MSNVKIPTFLGVILVLLMVAGLFVTTQGLDKITTIFSQADETVTFKDVSVANITNSSLTVFWTTDVPTDGAVFYGKSESLEDGAAVDERTIGPNSQKYLTHLVKINNLSPNTKYYFKVGQTKPDSQIFEASTGPVISKESSLDPLTGKGAPNALAIWQAPGATKIATLVKNDGTYTLPISLSRASNLTSYYDPKQGDPEKIIINTGAGEGTINCQAGESSTLPEVKIGESIDCTEEQGSAKINDQGSFGNLLKNPTGSQSASTGGPELNIQSGETISTGLPTFSGKVEPKQIVKIVIHSEEVFTATVIAKPNGTWSWTPPSNLSPGEHTAEITLVNADGTTQKVTRTFFVTAGDSLLPITSGTPSGSLTPSPTPTPIITTQPVEDELMESGVDDGTILALTMGLMFTILSIGAFFVLN